MRYKNQGKLMEQAYGREQVIVDNIEIVSIQSVAIQFNMVCQELLKANGTGLRRARSDCQGKQFRQDATPNKLLKIERKMLDRILILNNWASFGGINQDFHKKFEVKHALHFAISKWELSELLSYEVHVVGAGSTT